MWHATPVKSEDKILRKCLKKETTFVLKNTREMHEITPFLSLKNPDSTLLSAFRDQFRRTNRINMVTPLIKYESVENAGVAFVKGVNEINEFFEKKKKSYKWRTSPDEQDNGLTISGTN